MDNFLEHITWENESICKPKENIDIQLFWNERNQCLAEVYRREEEDMEQGEDVDHILEPLYTKESENSRVL